MYKNMKLYHYGFVWYASFVKFQIYMKKEKKRYELIFF